MRRTLFALRFPVGVMLLLALLGAGLLPGPAAAATTTYTNPTTITIANQTTATPYPSNIVVVGATGTITKVTVTLNHITHTATNDIDILLVGPGGQAFVIFSDVAGDPATNQTVTLDDAAAAQLPSSGALVGGSYQPTNRGMMSDVFPTPAPGTFTSAAPAGSSTFASVFNGTAPNGTWSLYVVDDAGGAATTGSIAGGWSLTLSTNVAPVANNDAYTTNEDQPLTVNAPGVLGNDTDADGDTLTATLVSGPANGSVTLNPNGSFTYTPALNNPADTTFTYRACDAGTPPASCPVATVSITVVGQNDAPTANNGSDSTNEDTPKTITLSGADVDSGALTFAIVSQPSNGSVALTGNPSCTAAGAGTTCTQTATYTPAQDNPGNTSFTFQVCDNASPSLCSAPATFNITVVGQNDAPVNMVPGPQTTDQGVPLVFSTANGNAISVADVDAGSNNLEVALSVNSGTLTLGSTSGLNLTCTGPPACGGNGTGTVRFRGNLTDINAALQGLTYTPSTFSPPGPPFTLTIATDDRGNNGVGGPKTDSDTVSIKVRAATEIVQVSGTVTFGGSNAEFRARLRRDSDNNNAFPGAGRQIDFYLNGNFVGSATTNGSGLAVLNTTLASTGNVGTYNNAVEARFAGDADYVPSSGTGDLRVTRRVIFIKPVDVTRRQGQPNPAPTQPGVGPEGCNVELAPGQSFVQGDDFGDLDLSNLRCSFGAEKNDPPGDYFIGATGATSQNYDVRYRPGKLRVNP